MKKNRRLGRREEKVGQKREMSEDEEKRRWGRKERRVGTKRREGGAEKRDEWGRREEKVGQKREMSGDEGDQELYIEPKGNRKCGRMGIKWCKGTRI